MKYIHRLLLTAVCSFSLIHMVRADVASDLSGAVGYTVVAATTVAEVLENQDGEKFIRLTRGGTFKVELLLLDPLPGSDVVILAKTFPPGAVKNQKIPITLYKLIVDDEVLDAQPKR
jgi:hypothetical protein